MLNEAQLTSLRTAPLPGRNKVRLAMTLVGVTQVQLAAALGVTQAQVSDVVRGAYVDLPLERARAYANFFDCAVEELFPPRLSASGEQGQGESLHPCRECV